MYELFLSIGSNGNYFLPLFVSLSPLCFAVQSTISSLPASLARDIHVQCTDYTLINRKDVLDGYENVVKKYLIKLTYNWPKSLNHSSIATFLMNNETTGVSNGIYDYFLLLFGKFIRYDQKFMTIHIQHTMRHAERRQKERIRK